MSKPSASEYVNSIYGLFTPWEKKDFSAEVAEFFGHPSPLEIIPQPTYLGGDVVLDGDIAFGVCADRMESMPDAVASMMLNRDQELTIVQLQAIQGRATRLIKKWPFMLVGIAEEVARRSGAESIAILPAELNRWCPREGQTRDYVRRGGRSTDEVIRGFQLRYNGTAKRAGYKKSADGLYRKSLI